MDLQPVHHSRSLFCLAKQSLTISLLTLRCTNSANIKEERDFDPKKLNFTLPNLAKRIKDCKGIEIAHLISSLPHSGLRPDLLEYLQYYHPQMAPFLSKYWREACTSEFPNILPESGESWHTFYRQQFLLSKSKMMEAGSRLRDSYRGEEKKIHQLQTIAPLGKRSRPSTSTGKKPTSLMEKSRQEALSSASRSNISPTKPAVSGVVTFRMRSSTQKR